MCYLHEQGVVHRDLKASNVMWHADGRMVLSDYSLPRTASPEKTIEYTAGNVNYMSPEVFDGVMDTPCDVWAYACLMIETLCEAPVWASLDRN
mmetsp:Transcript_5413/g.3120  ORF Transcript_5413/g.3120 Transcript_5413/m.3120 type:complete len:93 (+) Transcript_5413:55-333(+)